MEPHIAELLEQWKPWVSVRTSEVQGQRKSRRRCRWSPGRATTLRRGQRRSRQKSRRRDDQKVTGLEESGGVTRAGWSLQ